MHRLFSMILLLSIIELHVIVSFSTECPKLSVASEIYVDNGGHWGSWGHIERCPEGSYAQGFSLKVEEPSHDVSDKTSVNGIRLHCVRPDDVSKVVAEVQSEVAHWGRWTPVKFCSSGFLIAFKLKVEPDQKGDDDTTVNNIIFRCSGCYDIQGDGTAWGNWGSWSNFCQGKGICGIKTLVERPQGRDDDTALNDVKMYCCD